MDNQEPKKLSRRRARTPKGEFKGNEGAPETQQAWEPTEIEAGLDKDIKYGVQKKVTGTSDGGAGKYSIKPKIRSAGFGDITVTEF